jgi:RNase P/RNase MRP subunit p30
MQAYDLHIRLKPPSTKTMLQMVCDMAQVLGFSGIAVESTSPLPDVKVAKGFALLHRMTLVLRSATRLRKIAERHRRETNLLVIHGRTKPICLAAALVPAIDMVMVQEMQDFALIDSQVARALAKTHKPLEVCLQRLIRFSGSVRSRLMRVMSKALATVIRAKCPIIFTSGAQHSYQLRAPRDLAAISYFADFSEDLANAAIFDTPASLVSSLNEAHSFPLVDSDGRRVT